MSVCYRVDFESPAKAVDLEGLAVHWVSSLLEGAERVHDERAAVIGRHDLTREVCGNRSRHERRHGTTVHLGRDGTRQLSIGMLT